MNISSLLRRLAFLAVCLLAFPVHGQYGGSTMLMTYPSGPLSSMYPSGYIRVQVPIERVGHSFSLKWRTAAGGAETTGYAYPVGFVTAPGTQFPIGSNAVMQSLLVIGYPPSPTYVYTPVTYTSGGVTYTSYTYTMVPFSAVEWWLSDTTAGQDSAHRSGTPGANEDLLNATWTQPPGSSRVANRTFAIPDSRLGHGLVAGSAEAGWISVTQGYYTIGTYSNGTSGSTVSLHWFTGSAPGGPGNFYVADRTDGMKAPLNQTNVISASWVHDYSVYPLSAVTIYLPAAERNNRYVLHYQIPGQVAAASELWPATVSSALSTATVNAGTLSIPAGAAKVSGLIAVGANFWVTRNIDAYTSPVFSLTAALAASATPKVWSLAPPAETVPRAPKTFGIATGRVGQSFSVLQPSSISPVMVAETDLTIQDYNTDGSAHDFHYFTATAMIHPNEPFWLIDSAPLASQGEVWITDGWQWIGGTAGAPAPGPPGIWTFSLQMSGVRTGQLPGGGSSGHYLTMTSPDGMVSGTLAPSSAGISPLTLEDPWHATANGPAFWQTTQATMKLSLQYTGPTGAWTLRDWASNEVILLNPMGVTNYANDLRTLLLPNRPLSLQISLSRLGHRLTLRQRDGSEWNVAQGASMGDLSLLGGFTAWINSYYYFEAGSFAREGIDYWLYDADTEEESPYNTPNLINWFSLPTPDAPAITDLGAGGLDIQWPLGIASPEGAFRLQRRLGPDGAWTGVPASADIPATPVDCVIHFPDTTAGYAPFVEYRVRYTYGGRVSKFSLVTHFDTWLDTDSDGISDAWEITHFGNLTFNRDDDEATNGTEGMPDPALIDTDGDSIPDEAESAAGTNPNSMDTDNDDASDPDEIESNLNASNPDIDSDGVKDGRDSYPKDPRRSVNFARMHYVPVDLSTPWLGAETEILSVQIDDDNRVGFLYHDPNNNDNVSVVYENGQFSYATLPAERTEYPWRHRYTAVTTNAKGHLAGYYSREWIGGDPRPTDWIKSASFSWPRTGVPALYDTVTVIGVSGITNDDLVFGTGASEYSFIGTTLFPTRHGAIPNLTFNPERFTLAAVADGGFALGTWTETPSPAEGTAKSARAVWDSGGFLFPWGDTDLQSCYRALNSNLLAFGWSPHFTDFENVPLPEGSLHPFLLWSGTPVDIYSELPERFRRQVRWPDTDVEINYLGANEWRERALLNSANDLFFGAQILKGHDGEWEGATLLWDRSEDQMYEVEGPTGWQMNKDYLMVGLEWKLVPYGDPQNPRYTPRAMLYVPLDFVQIDDYGTVTDIPANMSPSRPSPKVDLNVHVSNLRRGIDDKILGTVHITGSITSDVCDTIPDGEGKIEEAGFVVNERKLCQFPVLATKGTGTDFGKPFPSEGAFDQTFDDVELTEGRNVVRVQAADQIYKILGSADWSVEIAPAAPTGAGSGNSVGSATVSVALPEAAPATPAIAQVAYTRPDGSSVTLDLVETAVGSGTFTGAALGVHFSLAPPANGAARRHRDFIARITDPALGFSDVPIPVGETQVGSATGAGAFHFVVNAAGQPVPPPENAGDVVVERESRVEETTGGEFHSFVARLLAPFAIATGLEVQLKSILPNIQESIVTTFIPGPAGANDPHSFLRRLGTAKALIFTLRPDGSPADAELTLAEALVRLAKDANSPLAKMEFDAGFTVGVLGGGYHLIADTAHLIAGALEYGGRAAFIPVLDVTVTVTGAIGLEHQPVERLAMTLRTEQTEANQVIGDTVEGLQKFLWLLYREGVSNGEAEFDLIVGQISGDIRRRQSGWLFLTQRTRDMFQFGAELFTWMLLETANLTPAERGYWMGRAVFEVGSLFVAPELAVAKLSKLRWLEVIGDLRFFQAGIGARAYARLAPLLGKLRFYESMALRMDEGAEALTVERTGKSVLLQIQGEASEMEKLTKTCEDLKLSNDELFAKPIHGNWNRFLRIVSHETITKISALISEANNDLAKLRTIIAACPTVRKWNKKAFKRIAKVETEVHHIVMESVVEALIREKALPEGFKALDVPGHAWLKKQHRAFTDATNSKITKEALAGMKPPQIAAHVLKVYDDYEITIPATQAVFKESVRAQRNIAEAWFKVYEILPAQ